MKPAPFEYFAPTSLEEALACLDEHGYDAKVMAGGQSLIPTMNFRLAEPEILVDLNRISELSYIDPGKSGGLRIGAMTRQREAERSTLVKERAPLVHETMPYIAHPQIRNRGTVGGSIAHADPASELPAVMLALDARFLLRSKDDERRLSADEFFIGLFDTAMEPEELLVEISLPAMPPNSGWAFREIARRHGDYALVGVAAVVTADQTGRCENARITFLSVGDGPVVAVEAGQGLTGQNPTEDIIRAAAETAAAKDIDPPNDIHASAEYRRHLAKVLTTQALSEAFARAKGV
ncbi:MAG: xanthine dehydrogenase family protein subunit M [bacterium]